MAISFSEAAKTAILKKTSEVDDYYEDCKAREYYLLGPSNKFASPSKEVHESVEECVLPDGTKVPHITIGAHMPDEVGFGARMAVEEPPPERKSLGQIWIEERWGKR